jgi:GNAT superfamily N-acetyltransferase
MLFEFMNIEEFINWYSELGKLKIFWAKPIESIELLNKESNLYLVSIKWIAKSKIKNAILAITETQDVASKIIELLRKYCDSVKLLMVPEDTSMNLGLFNAKSLLYLWKVNAKTLEPNRNVSIKTFSEWDENDIETFKNIHKKSWGFFIPPRNRDHIVIVAYLNNLAVGMGYLNIHNFNIDYGIHVIKSYWRKRIGTALLVKILELTRSMGTSYVSVVRVFRSVKGTSSDIRAVKFYRANNPSVKMLVYKLNDKM